MNDFKDKSNKRAAEIVCSLVSEGYLVTAHSDACGIYFLRHKRNKNVMRVELGELGVYVFKNMRLLKIDLVK